MIPVLIALIIGAAATLLSMYIGFTIELPWFRVDPSLAAILTGAPFAIMALFILITELKSEMFPIRSWKWIFYCIGFVTSLYTVVFWVILIIKSLFDHEGFFSEKLHKRIFRFGIIASIAMALGLTVSGLYLAIFERASEYISIE
ncbi:hypothetical protein ACFL1B_03745 [Nanoarchaeota archaeon]